MYMCTWILKGKKNVFSVLFSWVKWMKKIAASFAKITFQRMHKSKSFAERKFFCKLYISGVWFFYHRVENGSHLCNSVTLKRGRTPRFSWPTSSIWHFWVTVLWIRDRFNWAKDQQFESVLRPKANKTQWGLPKCWLREQTTEAWIVLMINSKRRSLVS